MKHTTTFLFLLFALFFSFAFKAQVTAMPEPISHGKKIYFQVLNPSAITNVNTLVSRFGNSDGKYMTPKYDTLKNVFSVSLGNDGRVIDINEILKQEFNLMVKQIDNPDPSANTREYNLLGESK